VLANLGDQDIEVEHASGWRVVLTSDLDPASEGEGFSGSLPARGAVVLEAAPV
jgi:hypothetical protein